MVLLQWLFLRQLLLRIAPQKHPDLINRVGQNRGGLVSILRLGHEGVELK